MTDELSLREKEAVCRITGLVLLNAMVFQEVLSEHDRRVLALREVMKDRSFQDVFIDHWEFIIEKINYYPIFHLARELLLRLSSNAELNRVLIRMAKAAGDIVGMRAALGHDLMGRVYHRLLADAKYLATYYTGIPAATLLLKLALRKESWSIDWHDLEQVRRMCVADIACGTGTLLMAAAEAITDNYISGCAARGQQLDLSGLHQILAADVLHGYDVLASALHLTASTLALRAPEVVFPRMQLFSLPLGGTEKRLGSIEFLEGSLTRMQTDLFGEREPARHVKGTGEEQMLNAELPGLDLCVMNPPFTRSVGGNLLFGSAPDDERTEMQRRLRQMVSKPGVRASVTAGLGSVFVAVADKHIKRDGRIALVLPKALLSGVAWNETRDLLRGRYQVEYVIASHDPEHWSFSESTNLSEVLLVARRTGGNGPGDDGSQVVAVNLWRNPSTTFDALAIANDLYRGSPPDLASGQGAIQVGVGKSKMGEAMRISWADLRKEYSWLLPCAFAQSDLIRAVYHLTRGELRLPGRKEIHPLPLCPLRKVGSLGPDRRDIHDGFAISRSATPYPTFWGHDSAAVHTMHQKPNAWLSPLPTAKPRRGLRKVTDLWPLAGRILLAERMRLNTQRLAALYVEEPVLANVWWPVSLTDATDQERAAKALVLWMNSTLGLTILLANRQETEGAWVDFKKPVLTAMPVLDTPRLPEESLALLASSYDRLCDQAVAPFPAMESDPVRAAIDEAVAAALAVPDLSVLRQMLAREPIVCLKPLSTPETPPPVRRSRPR